MKTIQMTLNEDLVKEVDSVVRKLKTTRSAFTRRALQQALIEIKQRELEKKHREGYMKHPTKKDEFSMWEKEQEWGDK